MTSPEIILGGAALFSALLVSVHATLRRRNPHAASWWIVVSWTFPLIGPALYAMFGINRIQRKAARLRAGQPPPAPSPSLVLSSSIDENAISSDMRHLLALCRVVENTAKLPLTRGNHIVPLINGDEAFPAMLAAIGSAARSVGLSTYIFENDAVGRLFIEALTKAAARGVQVRVLIDDVGAGFHWRSVHQELTQRKVPVAYFLPTHIPWRIAYMNMRNHRKILTIDGRLAFSGGMNITADHALKINPKNPALEVHFQIEGPVVAQIQDAFRVDWHFTNGEVLGGEDWFPAVYETGLTFARGIADGPDEDFEKGKLTILAALAHARRSVRIMTPYLIPDAALVSALNLSALSGVQVDVVLPSDNDMTVVSWATQAYLWQILTRGVRVWRTRPPFNHAKLMVVDGGWTFFGSTNWDPRSLRLNFEFNTECYGREIAEKIESHIDKKIASAHRVTLAEVDARPFPVKFRDGVARLFSPML